MLSMKHQAFPGGSRGHPRQVHSSDARCSIDPTKKHAAKPPLRARCDILAAVEIEERAKVVELIEAVIAADGVVADQEREFLRRVVERFGLSEADRADRI